MFILNNNSIYIEKEENYLCSQNTMMTSIYRGDVEDYKKKYPGQDKFCLVGSDYFKTYKVLSLNHGTLIPISSDRVLNLFKEGDSFPYLFFTHDKPHINQPIKLANTKDPYFDIFIGASFGGFKIDSIKRITLSILGEEVKEPKKELLHHLYFWGWIDNSIDLCGINYQEFIKKGYSIYDSDRGFWKAAYYIIDAKVIKEYEPSDDMYTFIPKSHISDSVFLYEDGKRIIYGIECLQKNFYIMIVKGIRIPKVIIPFGSKQFVCKIKIRSFKCEYQVSINHNIVDL